jgi:hypothetical protein
MASDVRRYERQVYSEGRASKFSVQLRAYLWTQFFNVVTPEILDSSKCQPRERGSSSLIVLR